MNPEIVRKLEALRRQYAALRGQPFRHFFCPITFRDEEGELCRAHIENQALEGAGAAWTVQRKDVDNFFGYAFEAEFIVLDERGKHNLQDIIPDRALARKLRPKILAGGKEVTYYLPTGPVPPAHTEVVLERDGKAPLKIAFKLEPSETLRAAESFWEIGYERDLRVPALVTALKAAHLTLFEMLGYEYALSAGGHLLGFDVLGKFCIEQSGRGKQEILAAARDHFREFANAARPLLAPPAGLLGTVYDRELYLCPMAAGFWAAMVFVRTGAHWHTVLVPILDDAECAVRYLNHLSSPSQRFYAKRARHCGDHWEVSSDEVLFEWPESRLEEAFP